MKTMVVWSQIAHRRRSAGNMSATLVAGGPPVARQRQIVSLCVAGGPPAKKAGGPPAKIASGPPAIVALQPTNVSHIDSNIFFF